MKELGKKIKEISFQEPFPSRLEYNAPARGMWNIVHTGMLLPGSHQIFVCARGCLRGVILTAAEMEAMDRMSWAAVREEEMFGGEMETQVVEATREVINRMDTKPKMILLFLSCIHLFAGCDVPMILKELQEYFPDIQFLDCYMHPTMRKSGLTPDATMRLKLYSFLEDTKKEEKTINIIGNDRETVASSELFKILKEGGFSVRDLTWCKNYEDYLDMSKSMYNLTYLPSARPAGDDLEQRLQQKHLYLPISYDIEEILGYYKILTKTLDIPLPDLKEEIRLVEEGLEKALEVVGDTEIVIDYTATSRPANLARVLLQKGFHVTKIYLDTFCSEDEEDVAYLKEHYGSLLILPTVEPNMRFFKGNGQKILAIGQKAAYFERTPYFVNMVAAGGYYGLDGICKLSELMIDAVKEKKDTREVIQHKGWGCKSCL